jgi:hypothetical protein
MSRTNFHNRLIHFNHTRQTLFDRIDRSHGLRSRYRRGLCVEPLENRRLLSITVDTLEDGIGVPGISLREAIAAASADETIDFAQALTSGSPATIQLLNIDGGQLLINKDLTIAGPGAGRLTIKAFNPNGSQNGSRIFNIDDGTASVLDVAISGLTLTGGDSGAVGGAISNHEELALTACTITGNDTYDLGGGIFNKGILTASECTVDGNVSGLGGGLYNSGTATITDSLFTGNRAGWSGAAVYNTGTLSLSNSTVSGNRVDDYMAFGSIGAEGPSSLTVITNCTIWGNTGFSGGIWAAWTTGEAPLHAANSIIQEVAGDLGSWGYNLIGETVVGHGFHATDLLNVDPRLGPLQDNGGPTWTHALLPGSPAIDAGDPMAVPGEYDVPAYDQRGAPFARVDVLGGQRIDIGAFEVHPPAALCGDYNLDGVVDAADYVVWRKTLGSSVIPYLGADGNGDCAVDQADRSMWMAHFGQTFTSEGTHARFLDVTAPEGGVFPTNVFTVQDSSNLTGVRINLPLPDATTNPADYQDTQVINTLDGFNLQPRLSIPFDGPIDVNSVTSETVFLIRLDDTVDPDDQSGQIVGINQVVWDTFTNTLHVESDELLVQHTSYALIVTNGVRDVDGQAVQPSEEFKRFRHNLNFGQIGDPALKEYRKDLLAALKVARGAGVFERDVVTASVFTTQGSTAVLEKIRDQIHDATPDPADFNVGLNGERTVFNLGEVTIFAVNQQTRDDQVTPPASVNTPLALLRAIPGAVDQVAFGKFDSPNYRVHPGEYIPAVGTRNAPEVQETDTIYFTLYLPSGTKPATGWPVAIVGHGSGGVLGNKDGNYGIPAFAAALAEQGIATIGINAAGFGLGPGSTITVTTVTPEGGGTVTLPAGGRAIDQNGDHIYGNSEGYLAAAPQAIISERDGRIQTDADLMQLVRVIQVGMDVDGDEVGDLDPNSVYYTGISLGGMYGAPFLAVEPDVSAGALIVLGGPTIERFRFGGVNRAGAGLLGQTAGTVVVSHGLLNAPGITSLDGLNVPAPYFDENMPLRDGVPLDVKLGDGTTRTIVSPVTNGVAGAVAIQHVFDNWEWVSLGGDPVAYAPYLRKDPLPGVDTAKSVLVQFAKGDVYAPNPTTTAFLRAGDLADQATYYRYDLTPVYFQDPNLRAPQGYPHTFAALTTSTNPTIQAIALAAQRQIAAYFASDGAEIIQPPGVPAAYFEVGMDESALPEGLNYTIAAPSIAPVGAVATSGKAVRSELYFDPNFTGTVIATSLDSNTIAGGRVGGTRDRHGEPYNPSKIELLAYAELIDSAIAANEAKGRAAVSRGVADMGVGGGVYSDTDGEEAVSIVDLDLVFADLGEEVFSGIGILT